MHVVLISGGYTSDIGSKGSSKMNYKGDYQPAELLMIPNGSLSIHTHQRTYQVPHQKMNNTKQGIFAHQKE
ncbi:MAG: hypothetical protein CM1200mP28_00910 [Deltaproteobacteria bacterium]|nr:MAG: hypothetical protein CM1200mP28_00910 [Deltaproteobacteria bacterium]